MTHPRVWRYLVLPALLSPGAWLGTGCIFGGQTGSEGKPTDTVVKPQPPCESTAEVIGVDQSTALGATPRQILSWLTAPQQFPLSWAAPLPGYSFGPEQGDQTIQLGVEYTSEPILWQQANNLVQCGPAKLSIPVVISVSTSGGALAEKLETTVTVDQAERASFSVDLQSSALRGTFRLSAPPGQSSGFLTLVGEIYPSGGVGSFFFVREETGPSTSSIARITLADWVSATTGTAP